MAYNRIYGKLYLYYCVTLLCAILSITSAEDNRLVVHLRSSTILQFRQLAIECEKKTGVPAENLKNLVNGTLPNDLNTKTFLNCIVHTAGYVDENGHFNVDTFLGSVLQMIKGTIEELADVLNKCNQITLENSIDTNYAMSECLHKECLFTFAKPETQG